MATNCEGLTCECDDIFAYEIEPFFIPPAISLDGLLWEIPCLTNDEPFECDCENPAEQIAVMNGVEGVVYQVLLLFRGVLEFATYTGGQVIANTNGNMIRNGTPTIDGHNIYKLQISDPPAIYYLNKWNGSGGYGDPAVVRYSATIQIRTGATATLTADVVNGTESRNASELVVTPLEGEPIIRVAQPYNDKGQFLQMDVTSVMT